MITLYEKLIDVANKSKSKYSKDIIEWIDSPFCPIAEEEEEIEK